ncbi:MAG: phage integrase family protein, partial [archaeon]|nr:phage integrase family protein [archaeon]
NINAKTRRRHLAAIRRFFNTIKKQKVDVEWPKYRSSIPSWITKDEVNMFISASDKYGLEFHCLFQLCYDGALRISEALNLMDEDLLFQDKLIRIKLPKSGKYEEEYVPIEKEATWGLIKDWLKEKHKLYPKNDYVFPGEKSKRLSRSTVDVVIKSICKKIGISSSKAHAHVLRHSRATHLRRDGMEIDELQKFLRHSDIKMTMIYDHIVLDDIRKRLSIIDG